MPFEKHNKKSLKLDVDALNQNMGRLILQRSMSSARRGDNGSFPGPATTPRQKNLVREQQEALGEEYPYTPLSAHIARTPTVSAYPSKLEKGLVAKTNELTGRKQTEYGGQEMNVFRPEWAPDAHHCPRCQSALNRPGGTRCYGKHVIACAKYHTRLQMITTSVQTMNAASGECASCASEKAEVEKRKLHAIEGEKVLEVFLKNKGTVTARDIDMLMHHLEAISVFEKDRYIRSQADLLLRKAGFNGWMNSLNPQYQGTIKDGKQASEVLEAKVMLGDRVPAREPDWSLVGKLKSGYSELFGLERGIGKSKHVKKDPKESYMMSRRAKTIYQKIEENRNGRK